MPYADPIKEAAWHRQYQNGAGKEGHRKSTDKWIARNPLKKKAQTAVANALRDGKLKKWPVCAMPECDRTDVQAHHADYSCPLSVVWLCPKCHKAAHAIVGFRNTGD